MSDKNLEGQILLKKNLRLISLSFIFSDGLPRLKKNKYTTYPFEIELETASGIFLVKQNIAFVVTSCLFHKMFLSVFF